MVRKHFAFISIFFFLIFNAGVLHSKSIYQKQINDHEIEIEFDVYYSNIDYYLRLTKTAIPYLEEENELKIYEKLILSPKPRFLVFEMSVNPLPCLGVCLRKNWPELYERAYLTKHFNLVKSVCAGFEEPYAASLFLGNVVSFKPKDNKNIQGKGYFGALLSAGNLHIKDNELIEDNWIEGEIKFKGDRIAAANKISWSFRIGTKLHGNTDIKDIIFFSLRRDRTDFDCHKLSVFKNSDFEYTFDIDGNTLKIIRHYFRAGKKIPIKNLRAAFSINTGFIWEKEDKYTGILRRATKADDFQVLLQPNIKF